MLDYTNMNSIGVVGSRKASDKTLLHVTAFVKTLPKHIRVVSGGARGVDQTAEKAATSFGLPITSFPVPQTEYLSKWAFKEAANKRNIDIVNASDAIVAFWDGKSTGTLHTITEAQKAGKPVLCYLPSGLAIHPSPKPKGADNIFFAQGDILDCNASVIVNPCNLKGVAGAGLSKQIAARYPAVFEAYAAACKTGLLKIGVPYLSSNPPLPGAKRFMHFPTKDHWKDLSSLDYIKTGLQYLVNHYTGYHSIAFPKLGCGLGGLNWGEVKPIMIEFLYKLPCEVVIFD